MPPRTANEAFLLNFQRATRRWLLACPAWAYPKCGERYIAWGDSRSLWNGEPDLGRTTSSSVMKRFVHLCFVNQRKGQGWRDRAMLFRDPDETRSNFFNPRAATA